MRWDTAEGLRLVEATDKLAGQPWVAGPRECVQIVYYESPSPKPFTYNGSQFQLIGPPIVRDAPVSQVSTRRSQQYAGKQIVLNLASIDRRLKVQWTASLRDEANYVRQTVQLKACADWVELNEIILVDVAANEAAVHGSVDGSPAVAGRWFMGLEHPMSTSRVREGAGSSTSQRVRCSYPYAPPLPPG